MRLVYKSKVVGEVMAYQARPIVGFNEWSATPELRYGPAFRGGLQWGIVGNGRKPDPVTFMKEEGFNCKLRVRYWKKWSFRIKSWLKLVPAVAVRQEGQALFVFIRRKGA